MNDDFGSIGMKCSGRRQANPTIATGHYSNFSCKRTHNTLFLSIAELARRLSEMPRLLAFLKLLRDERERGLGHFTPSVVNRQGMPAVGYFADLGHAGILLLLLVGGMGNRPRHGVVVLAGDDQQRSTLGILRVDLGFRPRIEIGGGRLEDRHTGAGHRVRLVQLVRFALVYGVGEGETELLVGQRDGAGVVEGVAQHRR